MRTKWYLLGCGTSIVLLLLLIIFGISGLVKASTSVVPKVQMNSALVISLDKYVPEYSDLTDAHFNLIPLSASDIIEKINTAAKDPKIKCIILKPNNFMSGYASLNEIMIALEEFKESGKKIYAYLNFSGQKDFVISTVADEVYLNPSASAGIFVSGIGSNMIFYKDLFDKIGVEYKVIRAGKFKSAGETFTRSGMSKEFRANLMELYGSIYNQLCTDLARNKDVEPDFVRSIFEKRKNLFIAQDEALNLKMVDDLIQESEFYKKIGIDEKHTISIVKYSAVHEKPAAQKIAIVYAMGEINSVSASFANMSISEKKMKAVLDKVKDDKSIKAVVLRVNSPGGSALESDKINYHIEELKKVKPVVVSMGDMAASGGYYISANANYIYADPYTITGSIGVISMLPDFSKLGGKIGLKSESAGYGKYISILDMWNPLNNDLLDSFQDMTDRTYYEFLSVVARGRNIDVDKVDDIAQGKVWSAPDAKRIGLIDEVGTIKDAVAKAAELVNLTEYSVAKYPEKRNLVNVVLEEKFDIQTTVKYLTGKYSIEFIPNQIQEMAEQNLLDPVQMILPFTIDN